MIPTFWGAEGEYEGRTRGKGSPDDCVDPLG